MRLLLQIQLYVRASFAWPIFVLLYLSRLTSSDGWHGHNVHPQKQNRWLSLEGIYIVLLQICLCLTERECWMEHTRNQKNAMTGKQKVPQNNLWCREITIWYRESLKVEQKHKHTKRVTQFYKHSAQIQHYTVVHGLISQARPCGSQHPTYE